MASSSSLNSYFSHLLIPLTFLVAVSGIPAPPPAVKGAYWPSSASHFPPSAIDTSHFTHIYFAFLAPNNLTFELEVSDRIAPLLTNFTSTLRQKTPPVKTLISVGGGGFGPALFARIASDASKRRRFINSTIEVARKYGFDGLDLDWEFPQSTLEMAYLARLLEEWRSGFEEEATAAARDRLLLTAAVYFSSEFFSYGARRAYPADSLGENLDLINVMCYDYHGSWDTSATGAHAALFDPKSNVSTSYGLGSWVRAGAPLNKIVMGLPLYGRTWRLKDPASHGIGAQAVGLGPGNKGTMTYARVEDFNAKNSATVVYDEETVSTYSFAGTAWIGYDDARSATTKVKFAKAHGLRGYFFWAVNGDNNWNISKEASEAWNLSAMTRGGWFL